MEYFITNFLKWKAHAMLHWTGMPIEWQFGRMFSSVKECRPVNLHNCYTCSLFNMQRKKRLCCWDGKYFHMMHYLGTNSSFRFMSGSSFLERVLSKRWRPWLSKNVCLFYIFIIVLPIQYVRTNVDGVVSAWDCCYGV